LIGDGKVSVLCQAKDWGDQIQQRATPWAKRL